MTGSKYAHLAPMRAPVILPSVGPHRASVIWSHGLGDSAEGWTDFADQVRRVVGGVKWIVTNAPLRSVTVNNGMKMPAWFDVKRMGGGPADEDVEGMLASIESIQSLVETEVANGIDRERIVVGGFSQGGILSLLTGLTSEKKLGGISVLSGYLGLTHEDKIKSILSPHALSTPMFIAHGTEDPVISHDKAERSVEYLAKELGMKSNIEWKSYEGLEHNLGREEMRDFVEWLKKTLT
ncbi:uncharacterized protein JCM6883_000530 [Sporobolomyces salmoneus]|uniref:uncharacterized protein n=1 Tax=Sporobolomyces salmoneus TaxID=183962 RepID=UPI00317F4E4A